MELIEILSEGMLLGVGVALIIIAVMHFYAKKDVELGLIAIIFGTSTIYNNVFFSKFTYSNPIVDILVADNRQILIIPLMYIFINRKFNPDKTKGLFFKHLIFPVALLAVYLLFKHTQASEFKSLNFKILYILMRVIPAILFIYYYIKGISFLKKYKSHVIASAYKRYNLFFHIVSIYLIGMIIFLSISVFEMNRHYYETPLILITDTLIMFLVLLFVLLFIIFELDFLNKLLPKKHISSKLDETSIIKIEAILDGIKNAELFANDTFSLHDLLKENEVTKRNFKLFILKKYHLNVNDYINTLRIEKFIELSKNQGIEKYDISGLSKLSGFKSKATFYRVFKSTKGMTPKEFFSNLNA